MKKHNAEIALRALLRGLTVKIGKNNYFYDKERRDIALMTEETYDEYTGIPMNMPLGYFIHMCENDMTIAQVQEAVFTLAMDTMGRENGKS